MNWQISLGSFAGVQLYAHWSIVFAPSYVIFLALYFDIPAAETFWLFLLLVAVIGCAIAHELGHALTAKLFDVPTKDIIITAVGGFARLARRPNRAMQEFWITLAGPLTNLAIAILFGIGVYFKGAHFWPPPPIMTQHAFWILMFWANLVLFAFNLAPAYPMDGGRVLRSCLSIWLSHSTATQIARILGQVLATFVILIGSYLTILPLVLIGVLVFAAAKLE